MCQTAKRVIVLARMVWAWLLTIPISGMIAYVLMRFLQMFGQAE